MPERPRYLRNSLDASNLIRSQFDAADRDRLRTRARRRGPRVSLARELSLRGPSARARRPDGGASTLAGRAATRPGTSDAPGRPSSVAAAVRPSSRSSSTRNSPRRARPSSSTSSDSTCSAPRCCASATTSSAGATSRRSCRRRRSGARASPSPRPARISPACARARCRTATPSSSTARRRGCRGDSTRRWCGVLARTDDSVPRHRGISMLIVDMSSPGVEVRPMTQITGHAEFSELFLDDVVVPKENLLGAARRRVEDRDAHARARAGNRRASPAGEAADVARSRGVASPPGANSTAVPCSRIRRSRRRWRAP